jgi:hypothetical protein
VPLVLAISARVEAGRTTLGASIGTAIGKRRGKK